MEQTLYQVLGVKEDADAQTIKNSFRKLAKKYHPDVNVGDKAAEKKFKEVNEAYSILSDEKKKRDYDLTLHQSSFQSNNTNTRSKASTTKKKTSNSQYMNFNMDFDDIFGAGMEYEGKHDKKASANPQGAPDFMNVNQQFANFFGFKPR